MDGFGQRRTGAESEAERDARYFAGYQAIPDGEDEVFIALDRLAAETQRSADEEPHQGSIARDIVVCVPRKTFADLKQNPRAVTPEDLLAVFVARGWTVRRGTRHGSIVEKSGHTHLVPRAHGKHLLPVYVWRATRLIDEVK